MPIIRYFFAIVIIHLLTPTAMSQEYRILSLGDSYTIGEAAEENERWPNQLAAALREHNIPAPKPQIIAVTGWTTTDLIEAIARQKPEGPFDLVTLLIGVNNQYQGKSLIAYENEFEFLLETAISLAGNDPQKVLVLSIPDYSVTPFASEKDPARIAREISAFNESNRELSQGYNVSYVNITPVSRQAASRPELLAPDGLHPSGVMYKLWTSFVLKEVLHKLGHD